MPNPFPTQRLPPAATIIAGQDAWEVDRRAAGLLGIDWRQIPHLKTCCQGQEAP